MWSHPICGGVNRNRCHNMNFKFVDTLKQFIKFNKHVLRMKLTSVWGWENIMFVNVVKVFFSFENSFCELLPSISSAHRQEIIKQNRFIGGNSSVNCFIYWRKVFYFDCKVNFGAHGMFDVVFDQVMRCFCNFEGNFCDILRFSR